MKPVVQPRELQHIPGILVLFFHEYTAQRSLVAHKKIPVRLLHEFFDGVGGIADGVQSPNDAAHAGARYIVHFQPRRIDRLQYPDMGQSFGPAAAQSQANGRAFFYRRLWGVGGLYRLCLRMKTA